jgi:hypothetical protein
MWVRVSPLTTGSPGFGTVTAGVFTPSGGSGKLQYPFAEGTVVPEQAAASYSNSSFVADGLFTAGVTIYGSGNPKTNVGNNVSK